MENFRKRKVNLFLHKQENLKGIQLERNFMEFLSSPFLHKSYFGFVILPGLIKTCLLVHQQRSVICKTHMLLYSALMQFSISLLLTSLRNKEIQILYG